MKPIVHISRGLLSSRSHSVGSGIPNLSRGLGRTSAIVSRFPIYTSRQLSTTRLGSISRLKGCRVTTETVCGNKRGLASVTEPTEPTDPAESSEPAEPAESTEPTEPAGDEKPSVELLDDISIRVFLPGKTPLILDRHWLRDSCDCSTCVDPDSGQKNFGTFDVPTTVPISKVSINEDQSLDIVWENDFLSGANHESHYPINRFRPVGSAFNPRRKEVPRWVLWDKKTIEQDRLTIDYDEWMAGEAGFISALHRLATHGLVFLRNVPQSEESVLSIANQIGNIQETFYGRTWDVRSKPNAENVAYTSSFLGLHQDLLYLAKSPRIQVLHCLENTCEGGESLFSDGARASNLLRIAPNSMLQHLASRPVRYSYNKNGHVYENYHPILDKQSSSVCWSPPFQSSDQMMIPNRNYQTFYRKWMNAAIKFRHLLEDEEWVYQVKMQPGDCVIFDNVRVLHGRKQFDTTTGSRHLKGTYIEKDVFLSKLKSLSPQLMAVDTKLVETLVKQAIRLNRQHKIWSTIQDPRQLENREKGMERPRSAKYKSRRDEHRDGGPTDQSKKRGRNDQGFWQTIKSQNQENTPGANVKKQPLFRRYWDGRQTSDSTIN